MAETQPQLQPALLRLSAMISQYFTLWFRLNFSLSKLIERLPSTIWCRRARITWSRISDALPFGRLWYGEPNAVSNAVDYAKHRSRSHKAVIRVYDECAEKL